jgi:two-component system sensor histidine kinase/response regulator
MSHEIRTPMNGAAKPLRILVADDNRVNHKVLSALLGPYGHELDFVSDGGRAVAAVEFDTFDLVIMDVNMPVMDGLAATRKIRSLSGPAAKLPIIALTANAMVGDKETYLAAGMNDYVSKPIRIAELLAAIARQRRDIPQEVSAPLAEEVSPQDAPSPSAGLEASAASLDQLLSAFGSKPRAA